LEGHRFSPSEALQAGFVDHLVNGDTNAIMAKAEEVAAQISSTAKEGVWGLIKVRSVFVIILLGGYGF
jgi:Delta3-Delta2-enoyl-CoA isomerase